MATKIIPKKSTVAAKVPLVADLDQGELAINLTDKKIYTKDGSNAIVELSANLPANLFTGTTFNGVYPMAVNVDGTLYSDADITFTGSTSTLTVPNISVTGTVDGRDISVDGTKLDGIEAGATAGMPATGTMTSLTIGAGVTLSESTDRADILEISSVSGGAWSGLQIYNSVDNLRCSFFCDGTTAGFYDDVVSQWMCKFEAAGQVELFHANVKKFETTTTGITVTGDVNSTSDRSLKENIVTLEDPIAKLKAINGYTYNFIENGERSVGVIAQEVEAVLPNAVRGEEGSKTVNYNALIGLLVEVNKEQQSKIESLEARLDALEKRLV